MALALKTREMKQQKEIFKETVDDIKKMDFREVYAFSLYKG